jgi:hypothetical protein
LNRIRIDFNREFNPVLAVGAPFLEFQAPNLEVNPNADPSCAPHCRCTINIKKYLAPANRRAFFPTATIAGQSALTYDLDQNALLNTYFEHAPFAGQNPFLRTYRRLCVFVPGYPTAFDTNVMIAVVLPCFDNIATTGLPATMVTSITDFQCANRKTNLYAVSATGDQIVANEQGSLGTFFTTDGGLPPKAQQAFLEAEGGPFAPGQLVSTGETETMRVDRMARSTCCGQNPDGATLPDGSTARIIPGVCINTNEGNTACCGRRPYLSFEEKCCDRETSSIRSRTQPCPCVTLSNRATGVDDQCRRQGPNQDSSAGLTTPISGSQTCCRITKFDTDINIISTQMPVFSFCADPDVGPFTGPWRCCNDGNVYDVASHQCCTINGVQSANIPCPCGTNNDCGARQACCTQLFPIPTWRNRDSEGPAAINQCSRFAAFPQYSSQIQPTTTQVPATTEDVISSPLLPRELFRCAGSCYNTDYQVCCNGRVCSGRLERCCNDTCCSRFTSGCMEGRRPGSLSSRTNPRDWSVYYETCSETQLLNGRKAFFVFILPTMLLFVTLLSLALVTVLARRATEHIFELTEKALVFLAVIATLLSCAYYFSPIYKNGVAIAFVSLAAILIAVARKTAASLFLVFLMIFIILYVIDPFSGNIFFGVTSANPIRDAPLSSSLLEASQNLWTRGDKCAEYYNNWFLDWALVDYQRHYNPAQERWGFCSRNWITVLMIFALLLYVLLLLMLLLAIFSWVKKIGVKHVEPIELEIVPEGPAFGLAPPVFAAPTFTAPYAAPFAPAPFY